MRCARSSPEDARHHLIQEHQIERLAADARRVRVRPRRRSRRRQRSRSHAVSAELPGQYIQVHLHIIDQHKLERLQMGGPGFCSSSGMRAAGTWDRQLEPEG